MCVIAIRKEHGEVGNLCRQAYVLLVQRTENASGVQIAKAGESAYNKAHISWANPIERPITAIVVPT